MILHLADAVNNGFRRIMLRTVDTDVVVLAVAAVDEMEIRELWVAFGTAQHLRTYLCTRLLDPLVLKSVGLCQYSMHILDVTRCPRSLQRERKQHGIPGRRTMK